MQQKKKCFVIMPVSKTESCSAKQWTTIFDEMIRPAVLGSRLGFVCERARPRTGSLIKDILNELNRADVVIADLTDTNPNVFYELGVRHTLRNRTILIAQDMKYVPSDLTSYWVVTYKKSLQGLQGFKKKMKGILREMMTDPEKPDNPVADFLGEKNISLLSQEKATNLKMLTALVGELSFNIDTVDAMLAIPNEKEDSQKKPGWSPSPARFDNSCLSILLCTRYIELPQRFLEELNTLNQILMVVNTNLEICLDKRFSTAVEEKLGQQLPRTKKSMVSILKRLNQIRLDYMKDNFQEETTPVLLLSSQEHKQYIESA